MNNSESVVFFGTGPVAAKALRLLAQSFVIEAVITKPKPEHHKGLPPVLTACHELGLHNVLAATNKQELSELFANHQFGSRVGVVIDFGIIIAQDVIDAFELGIINSHFSLLPRWRGADPITFAILSGDEETGVSIMRIVEKLDEGPLLAQQSLKLTPEATTPLLTEQLITLSNELLKVTLPRYFAGQVKLHKQPSKGASYSRKLTKADGHIDWDKPAAEIERQIRAFLEWPKSRTNIGGRDVVITAGHVIDGSGTPGVVWLEGKQLGMHTPDGIFVIDRLIPAGKKEMAGADFLLGYQLTS